MRGKALFAHEPSFGVLSVSVACEYAHGLIRGVNSVRGKALFTHGVVLQEGFCAWRGLSCAVRSAECRTVTLEKPLHTREGGRKLVNLSVGFLEGGDSPAGFVQINIKPN